MAKDFKKATQTMTTALDALLPDTAQQEQEALEALQTQGKKGMKLPRINLAFSPSNLDYIRVMSGIRGESMTQFVNYVIAKDREAHGDKYQAAKALMEDN